MKCPKHSDEPLQVTRIIAERIVIDLVFMKSGVRKTVKKHVGTKGYCQECARHYNPCSLGERGNWYVYGHGFRVWVMYQRLSLRLPYRIIIQTLKDLFDEEISETTLINFASSTGICGF